MGAARLVTRTIGALVRGSDPVPPQELVFLGGPISAPGYQYHSLGGTAAISQRVELRFPVPFPAVSLGRFGRSAARAQLAPYATAVALRSTGIYPSAGLGLLVFFDLLRLEVARGLRDGRWSFYLDVNRAFWSVL